MRLIVALIIGVLVFGTVPVGAQNNTSNTSDSGVDDPPERVVEIASNVFVTDYWYDDNTFHVEVEVNRIEKRVTLIEAKKLERRGGVVEPAKEQFRLKRGKHVLTLPVEENDGKVGVWVSTNEEVRGLSVEVSAPLIGGPWSPSDVQLAGLTGMLSGIGVMSLIGWKRKEGIKAEANRVI